MNRGSAGAVAAVAALPAAPVDWRVERLTSLMGENWLGGEWDGERQLILPRPGGRLTRVVRCGVPDCPGDAHGANVLCHLHRRQFDAWPGVDVQGWLATVKPDAIERRWCSERRCAVTGADGGACSRPAEGPWRLCHTHSSSFDRRRARGSASRRSCLGLGHCPTSVPARPPAATWARHIATAVCARSTTRPGDYQVWRREGAPTGAAFAGWAARLIGACGSQP